MFIFLFYSNIRKTYYSAIEAIFRCQKYFLNKKTHVRFHVLTMNEGAIEPLDVIVFREGEEDLVTND